MPVFVSGEQMRKTSAFRGFLFRLASLMASFLLVFVGVIVSAPQAVATTNTPIAVKVTDTSSPIGGVVVNACVNLQSPNPTCVQGTTASNGEVTINFPLSSPNQTVILQAGDWPTNYSYQQRSVVVTGGVAPTLTELHLYPTTWLDVSVTVVNSANNAPIANEYVEVSSSSFQDWRPWSTTNSQGVGVIHLDANIWANETITARSGNENSTWQSSSAPVSISGNQGSATISTQPLSFAISGTVQYQGAPFANQPMSARFNVGQAFYCRDFTTDHAGGYSVSNINTTRYWIEAKSCSESTPESRYDPYRPNFNGLQPQTIDFELHKTGIEIYVTDAGNPSPNVEITLEAVSSPWPQTFRAVTDNNGIARFVGLEVGGQYQYSYVPDQYSMMKYGPEQGSSILTVGQVDTFTNGNLELTRLDSYPQTPVEITGRVVTGINSTPIANALIYVNWTPPNGGGGGQGINFPVRTDSQGYYRILELPYGQTNVTFTATGFRRTGLSLSTSPEKGNSYNFGVINLRPQTTGELSYSGVLKDSSGNPILNRQIVLSSSDDGAPHEERTSSIDGSFSFEGLSAGAYYLFPDTWSDSQYSQLTWNFSFVDLVTTQSNVQVILQSRSPGQASVSGFVGSYVDIEGENSATPRSGLNVFVWPVTGGPGFNTITDNAGNWTIGNLTEGIRYFVSVQLPNNSYEQPSQSNIVTATTSGGERNNILLKQISAGAGVLTGRVKDATNYSNLEGIQVTLYRANGGFSPDPVFSDERGEYSFTGLPEGEYILAIGDGYNSYRDAFMSVEILGGSNRVNALLSPIEQFEGSIEGVILDDRGIALPGATVQVWSPKDPFIGGSTQTDAEGRYRLDGIPTNIPLNFKVNPSWDLRYEVSAENRIISLEGDETINVQLQQASYISGVVSGIPGTGNVPQVSAELVDTTTGTVVSVDAVDSDNGNYSLTSVPPGSYHLRFTQRANYEGFNGGGGWGFASSEGEQISLRPVYYDGTTDGTENRAQASTIHIQAGDRISGKSVTLLAGSSIHGTVFVETPDGPSRLTGTRSVQVTVFKKQTDGSWEEIGYPESANGFSNSNFNVYGLGQGIYKLRFDDSRRGNNSLERIYNGGATTFAQAPEINVGEAESVNVSQTLFAAPPERSAEAFDLDELGQDQLEQLRDQINIENDLSAGSEESIYVGVEFAGEYVSAFANSTPTSLGGWKQVDSSGYIKVVIPADFVEGSHRIAVQDANLQIIGWSAVTVSTSDSEAGVLVYSPRKAVNNNVAPVVEAPTKEELNKSSASASGEDSAEIAPLNSMETENNIWIMYIFGSALLLSATGAIWLIRSSKR
ncbi:carboxypeptidase regulatory-like domain-containing protein [Aurantimicrobium minutum]|uniref:carboxypeptidase regulatory-like domain-containing protein n=1 Tax=Aurantimicrobium minutum TaxID=708131 RepID=UPI00247386B8|nr:carboxypeptidase regulatory-like domain-containing protein [Aurantimicrobium minutum]MDH6238665.1 hypothetical protein [Aurantimicrobium minutum]